MECYLPFADGDDPCFGEKQCPFFGNVEPIVTAILRISDTSSVVSVSHLRFWSSHEICFVRQFLQLTNILFDSTLEVSFVNSPRTGLRFCNISRVSQNVVSDVKWRANPIFKKYDNTM